MEIDVDACELVHWMEFHNQDPTRVTGLYLNFEPKVDNVTDLVDAVKQMTNLKRLVFYGLPPNEFIRAFSKTT
jgi:hypothetical protein